MIIVAMWYTRQDGKRSVEGQVGLLGFLAHGVHQILGHVQAAQLRAMAGVS